MEPQGLIHKDNKRRDGMTITPWTNGKRRNLRRHGTIASSYIRITSKKLMQLMQNSKSRNVHAKSFYIQKISLAMQRENIAAIPQNSKLNIFFLF